MARILRPLWSSRAELPTVTIEAADIDVEVSFKGHGGQQVELTATVHDLFRSLGGRRTVEQITSLNWNGPDPAIQATAQHLIVPFFSEPANVVESA